MYTYMKSTFPNVCITKGKSHSCYNKVYFPARVRGERFFIDLSCGN